MRSLLATILLFVGSTFANAEDAIPVDVLNRIKGATAFIKVSAGRLEATGSGFLMQVDGDTALIVTNDHVVVPPKELKLPRATIEVIFNSGRKNEVKYPAEIVATDNDRDLAILRVKNAKDLPKALDLNEKVELSETMPVYMFGFPFGAALSTSKGNPAITIGKGGVSSLREDDLGRISRIQIDGDLNPGNSGGPVVDVKGRLVGVAVAKIRGTNIGLAIPARELSEMLNGRVSGVSMTTVKVENGAAEIEFTVRFIDPLNKIAKASILVLRADLLKNPLKADKDGKFPPMPNAEVVELKIENQIGKGKVILKSAEKEPVAYLFQPGYVKGDQTLTYTSVGGKPHLVDFGAAAAKAELPEVAPRPVSDINVRSLSVGRTPACMCWSDDAKAFFQLDSDGVVRRFSYPEMKEEATNAIGKKCSWISLSSEGLVATVGETQEAWLLDAKTLKESKKFPIGKSQYVVSSPKIAFAYAADRSNSDMLTVLDLKTGAAVKRPSREFGAALDHPVLSADGKYLFTTNALEMFRIRVSGDKVTLLDKVRVVNGAFTGICISNGSDAVCAPSGGGNFGAPNYSTSIFSTSTLSKPALTISSGAWPSVVGFDLKSGFIYAQNMEKPLIIFDCKGIKLKEYALDPTPRARTTVRQFLVHPNGRQLLVLADGDVRGKPGSRIFAVELLAEGMGTQTALESKAPDGSPPPKDTANKPDDKPIPKGWKEVAPAHCTYKAAFPPDGTVKESEDSVLVQKAGQMRFFRCIMERKDGSIYGTSQINIPPTIGKQTVKQRQDMFRDLALDEFNGKLVDEKKIEMGGMNGKEWIIETPKGKIVRYRVIGAGVQIWRMVVIGTKDQTNSADADAFFDAFKRNTTGANPKPDDKK